ncbi:MAG: hypothetical protein AAB019_07610 [Planctomycetota bacterium]
MKKIPALLVMTLLIWSGCEDKKPSPLEPTDLKKIETQLEESGFTKIYRETEFVMAYPETWDEEPYDQLKNDAKKVLFRGDKKDGVPETDDGVEVKIGMTVVAKEIPEGMGLDDLVGMEIQALETMEDNKLTGEPVQEKVKLLNGVPAHLLKYELFNEEKKRYAHRYQLVTFSQYDGLNFSVIGFVTTAVSGDEFLKKYGLDEKIRKHILTFVHR